jgi:hypothetical protein
MHCFISGIVRRFAVTVRATLTGQRALEKAFRFVSFSADVRVGIWPGEKLKQHVCRQS